MGFRHTYYSSFRTGRKRGVAILMPNMVHFEVMSETDDKRSFIMVKSQLDDKEVTLLNVYAPLGSNKAFYKKYLI